VRKPRFALDRLVAKRARPSHLVIEAVALDRDGGPVPSLAPSGLIRARAEPPLEMRPGASQCFSHVELTPLLKLGPQALALRRNRSGLRLELYVLLNQRA
jgi:hypothetical protein